MRKHAPWITGVSLLALAVGVMAWGAVHRRNPGGDVDRIRTGECVRRDITAGEPPYRIVGCTGQGAEFVVLRMLPEGGAGECRTTPGGALWFAAGKGFACLGPVGVDPATAVNVAQPGDCLFVKLNGVIAEGDPLRVPCTDPRPNMQVLRRLQDVPKYGNACRDVRGTSGTHGWNWVAENPIVRYEATIDVLLCIGPSRRAQAAAAASAKAQAAAVHKCRFATVREMSGAVSRAAGRTWTARSAQQDELDCEYRFGGRDTVTVWFTAGADYFRPGSGDEVLKVDGLRAIYGPGEGNRSLSVFAPAGKLTVIVGLDGVDDRAARRIGVEVFRLVRKRLA